eukprot:1323861-Amorphochlora_amoeboformis.AAC.1
MGTATATNIDTTNWPCCKRLLGWVGGTVVDCATSRDVSLCHASSKPRYYRELPGSTRCNRYYRVPPSATGTTGRDDLQESPESPESPAISSCLQYTYGDTPTR